MIEMEMYPNRQILAFQRKDQYDQTTGLWKRKVRATDIVNTTAAPTTPASTASQVLCTSTTDAYNELFVMKWSAMASTAGWFALAKGTSTIDYIYLPSAGTYTKVMDWENPITKVSNSSTIRVIAVTPVSTANKYCGSVISKKEQIQANTES